MIAEMVNDMKADFREQPGFAAALILAVVMGVGFNAAVFFMADGDGLRLSANGSDPVENQINAMRSHVRSAEPKPGFTVIVGMRQYSVELSVPLSGMCSISKTVRSNVAEALRCRGAKQAA
jgi:hypothetical protein